MDLKETIKKIRLFLLDMDGTVYLSGKLIDGARETIEAIRGSGRRFCMLTNNSSVGRREYLEKLSRLDIRVLEDEVFTSGLASAYYLRQSYPAARVFLLGTSLLKDELKSEGINIVEENPDVVLVGFDTNLTYLNLVKTCNYIRKGLPYVITHPDVNCPVSDGFIPDVGSFVSLIKTSTGRTPDAVCGKPTEIMLNALCSRFNISKAQTCMIGDRLETDVLFAKQLGFTGVLVLSGVTTREAAGTSEIKPDFVLDSLKSLKQYL